MDTTAFLLSVKRNITIPTYDPRFNDAALIALANEEQVTSLMAEVIGVNQEYFVTRSETVVVAGTERIRPPERCTSRTVRMVHIRYTGNTDFVRLVQVTPEQLQPYTQPNQGNPSCYTWEGDWLRFHPVPANDVTIRFLYSRDLSDIVPVANTAKIELVTLPSTVEVDTIPQEWELGQKADITYNLPGNEIITENLTLANLDFDNNVITFAEELSTQVGVKDVVSLASQTSVLQMPVAFQIFLAQCVALRVLQASAIEPQLTMARDRYGMLLRQVQKIIEPRDQSNRNVWLDNSFLNGGTGWRRFPSVTI